MYKTVIRLIAVALVVLCAPNGAVASISTANQGFVGLWEYPTAEMPADGAGHFGLTYAKPYSYYYLSMAWLPWLEINGRFTLFDNIGVIVNGKRERDYMDKAIDAKVMLHRSRNWYMPSVAVGGTDLKGTELMKAWYGVATWRRDNLAFSMGYGTDRLNGFFAGASWNVDDWLTLKA
ncbi:MAG: YjbH domain-containing protein, partial [Synergistaceae bacterium]|nr:YjbH domain-containing protein [Synergistaceae bacterium]